MAALADIVFLVGNGLSIGVSDHFAVANLTERLEAALDEPTRAALAEIAVLSAPEIAAGREARSAGFEDIVGPLDRIASAVRTLAPLAGSPDSAHVLIEAYEYLRQRYVQLVGIVLSEVTGAAHLPSSTDWTSLNDFADRLSKLNRQHDVVIFTLNYDTLLESALLERHPGRFYDGFAGMSFNHPLDRRPGTIGAYHLHGSALWFQDPSGASSMISASTGRPTDAASASRPIRRRSPPRPRASTRRPRRSTSTRSPTRTRRSSTPPRSTAMSAGSRPTSTRRPPTRTARRRSAPSTRSAARWRPS